VAEQRKRKKLAGRSRLAREAHFRLGGAMGGTRKQQARRKRRAARDEERKAEREAG
jgi:hypothetical protein